LIKQLKHIIYRKFTLGYIKPCQTGSLGITDITHGDDKRNFENSTEEAESNPSWDLIREFLALSLNNKRIL